MGIKRHKPEEIVMKLRQVATYLQVSADAARVAAVRRKSNI